MVKYFWKNWHFLIKYLHLPKYNKFLEKAYTEIKIKICKYLQNFHMHHRPMVKYRVITNFSLFIQTVKTFLNLLGTKISVTNMIKNTTFYPQISNTIHPKFSIKTSKIESASIIMPYSCSRDIT